MTQKADELGLREQLAKLVHAIRNDGWNNGFNTDDEPWIEQLLTLVSTREKEARIEGFEQALNTYCIKTVTKEEIKQLLEPQKEAEL